MKDGGPPGPRWEGQPIDGQTLLFDRRTGLGDSVQFIRYAGSSRRPAVPKGLFDCPEGCRRRSSPRARASTRSSHATNPPVRSYNSHIPLLSLPGIFGVPPKRPPHPYPTSRPIRPASNTGGRNWSASQACVRGLPGRGVPSTRATNPLCSPQPLRPAGRRVPGVRLCSIQKGAGTEQRTDASVTGMNVIDLGARTGPGRWTPRHS